MMRNIFIIYLLTIVHWQSTYAQFTDNFTDGNFSANPAWQGDNGKFSIASGQLRLQAEAVEGKAYLATASSSIINASFEFLVQMDFNPSNANLCKVFLTSNQADLTSSLTGYFVEIGSTADEVSLYRQDGTTANKIIDGLDKTLNATTVSVKVKVTRDANGKWQLYSDVGNTGRYKSEGVVIDVTYPSSAYFGVLCQYTSTRSTGFHFDDFVVGGETFKDVIPPSLNNIDVTSSTTLDLRFSEALQQTDIGTLENYHVDNEIGNPSSAVLQSDGTTVKLVFKNAFGNGVSNFITVKNIKDTNGNTLANTQMRFMYFEDVVVEFRDVVVSEIMADPEPQVQLPQAEFIELYNRSQHPVKLDNWVVTDGTSTGHMPSQMLQPSQYLILTSTTNASLFKSYNNVIGVPGFPTLNNSGDAIVIKNDAGAVVDSLLYGTIWYGDDDKKEGGWTLEKIDVNNICSESENWTASASEAGGTPGQQNSVHANKPDVKPPSLQTAYSESPASIVLIFNEKLETTLPAVSSFTIDPLIPIKKIDFTNSSLTTLELTTSDSLTARTAYTVGVSNVYDCAGNKIADNTSVTFGLQEDVDSLDLVINEILFNPKPTGVDFVEVFNKSEKYINLSGWSLANYEDNASVNKKPIGSGGVIQLAPHDYLVFTTKKNLVTSEYPKAIALNCFEISSLPSMNDDSGSIAIVDADGKVIDAFVYSDNMQSPLLQDAEGVSLERIQGGAPTNDAQNWRSASETSGFATPGYLNSNSRTERVSDNAVVIEPEIFDPVSGLQNFAEIKYNFDQGGSLGNVKIFDLEGREVKAIASNSSLNTQGFFRWDGDTNSGARANVGYYVVRFEVFDASGSVKTYHKRVVVAAKF